MNGLLDGVRVLDLTNVLAGPFAGYQLALLGADVLKVEIPGGGDLARRLGADPDLSAEDLGVSFLAQNSGKRSLTLDLKSEKGAGVFIRLVEEYDVVLENFRPGVMERLGFGWERLREINPKIVYCAVSGFGQSGPMSDRPAYDQIIQGLSGLMSVTGTPDTAPLRVGAPICDSIGGLMAALGVASALVRRNRSGEGAYLDVSMLEAAIACMGWVASDQMIAGRAPVAMANENRTSAPSGTFDTGDGKLNIAANKQEQFDALCKALGREELMSDPRFVTREDRKYHRDLLKTELEDTLRTRSAAEWDRILLHTGVPAAPVVSVGTALQSSQIRDRGLVARVDSPAAGGGALPVLGSAIHVDRRAISPRTRPPRLGEHTEQVLRELGYDDREIDDLRKEAAV
ncbi:CoA transferase [Nocardioides sp. NBC_00850]|uniref:CaiB/BaiF CoA transferase family protein n=1 Tax=Nocardioides sp. NBC_00850 TaxID=2976001 RepID=UPI003870788C|nr:CoA transferase [Nocardioides sp. NBC_00850]